MTETSEQRALRLEKRRANYAKNKEYYHAKESSPERKAKKARYLQENKEKIATRAKKYQESHKEQIILSRIQYRKNNKDKIKQYEEENKLKIRVARQKRQNERYATDPQFRLKRVLRARVSRSLKWQGAHRIGKTMELTGCTIEELIVHLESLFEPGMSWDNYGKQTNNRLESWEIDHIRPIVSFDLTDDAQQRQCWHYTNLQPLWAVDNMKKKANLNWSKTNIQ